MPASLLCYSAPALFCLYEWEDTTVKEGSSCAYDWNSMSLRELPHKIFDTGTEVLDVWACFRNSQRWHGGCAHVCRHASSYWMAVSIFCCTNSSLFGVLPTNRLYSLCCRVPVLLDNCNWQPGLVVSNECSAASVAGWLMWTPHREALALWRFWSAAAW